MKVAIIGSSLSGCFAANLLQKKGIEVVIFEKGNKKNNKDNNEVIKSAFVKGNKTTVLNEGIGGTSQLWTGGLVRNYDKKTKKHSKIIEDISAIKEISRFFNIDSFSLISDIRLNSKKTFQKTTVLFKPKRGGEYLKNLLNKKNVLLKANSLVTGISCSKNKVIIKYKTINYSKYSLEEFDKCFLANGLIGFHQLLPKIEIENKAPAAKIKSKYNLMTHPKADIGKLYSNEWNAWNKVFGEKSFKSNCYIYERILVPIKTETKKDYFVGLRIDSRRTSRITKLSIILLRFLNPIITKFLITKLDFFYCLACKIFNLVEKFNIRIFIADEFKGETYLKYEKNKLKLYCSINENYLDLIHKKIIEFFNKNKFKNIIINDFIKWEVTTLHSHLCGSLLFEDELKNEFESNNLEVLSTLDLPIGYYNPMLESLIQTYIKINKFIKS